MNKYVVFLLLCMHLNAYTQPISTEPSFTIEMVSAELNKFHNLRDFSISPNEDEAFFTVQSPNGELSMIVCVNDRKWDDPTILPFCDRYAYLEPFLSNDGKRLYFASNRPKSESDTLKSDFDLWYVERKDSNSEWSYPINMGSQVNSKTTSSTPHWPTTTICILQWNRIQAWEKMIFTAASGMGQATQNPFYSTRISTATAMNLTLSFPEMSRCSSTRNTIPTTVLEAGAAISHHNHLRPSKNFKHMLPLTKMDSVKSISVK